MAVLAGFFVEQCAQVPPLVLNLLRHRDDPWGALVSQLSTQVLLQSESWGYFSGLFLAFQMVLRGLHTPRLQLTRPLAGAVLVVALESSAVCLGAGFGVEAMWLPLGLSGLWLASNYGVGAGLLGYLACLGVAGAGGYPEVFDLTLVTRGVVVIGVYAWGKRRRSAWLASWAAGGASAICFVLIHSTGSNNWGDQGLMASLLFVSAGVEALAFWAMFRVGQRILGHVSREKLVALLDLSQPLLKRMMEEAPGSFEHSRAMANLAEQAASSVGADALLTRVGAYYHDLGKSVEPKFFVENLLEGETSAHEGLTPRQSVSHIVRHVTDGVQILRDAGIPEPIVEFSYTHHGSQYVEYFLNQERQLCPEEEIDMKAFAYPGMRPSTKETAILMLVDSIEAASRTIDSRERDKIKEVVWRIIFSKLAAGQLDDSGLSMKELRIISGRVVETLIHMNHHRIKYPWQEERKGRNPQKSQTQVCDFPKSVHLG